MFGRGLPLDAQVLYGGNQAYANYVFGVYMSAAGLPLDLTLAAAEAYGKYFSDYSNYKGQMSSDYPDIPQVNVDNIIRGYKDEKNGTLCQ
jgi:hypothetical protein